MQYRFILAIVVAIITIACGAKHRTGCGNHQCNNNAPCRDAENNTAVDNPAQCDGFFHCLDGSAIPGTCPPGQWFNPETSHCDSNDAKCPEDEDFECPDDDGVYFFPSEQNCDEYIMCFGGVPVLRSCAKGLHFDPRNLFCTLPERAECKLNICPEENDPWNIVFIPSEVDCELYYICFDGETIPQRCAPDFHWDIENEVCNFPDLANCTAKEAEPEPDDCPAPHEVECPKDGLHFFPHPYSCKHYFVCTNGEYRLMRCANNLQFDPENEWCDFEENVQCDAGNSTSSSEESEEDTTERPIPEPHEIDCPSDDGFYCIKHPNSCEWFFMCKNGISTLIPCAFGQWFDPIRQWCDRKDNVRCHLDHSSEEDIPVGPPPTEEPCPEPHETDCPSDEGFSMVEHPKSCEHFFFCIDGISIVRPCAPGLWFDPIAQWCDVRENVDCPHANDNSTSSSEDSDSGSNSGSDDSSDSSGGSSSGSDDESSEETTPRPIPEPHEIDCPSDDGFYCIKHPNSCEWFFMCKNGISTLIPCAFGQWFDPIRQWCDRKDNVRCHLDHSSEEDIPVGPPPTEEPCPEPHETDCPSDEGFSMVEHPKSCEHFFFCIDGISIVRPCAPGLWFDPIAQWCDIPENVDCPHANDNSTSSSEDSNSGSNSGSDDSSDSSKSGDDSDSCDDSDSGSNSGSDDSSDSSKSGDDSDSCDESDSGSNSGSDDSSDSSKSGDDSDSCDDSDSGSNSGSDDSSDSSGGSSSGSDDESSEETTPRPIPEPHEIDCPSDDGFYCIKHPNSCEWFFMCKNGISTLIPCAFGQWFDPIRQWCDRKDNVRCHLDHSSEEDIPPGPPPTEEPCPEPHETECPSDEGFSMVEHPKSCEHFFFCIDGISIVRPCAPGLWFDPIAQWCDVPENVDCPHANDNSTSSSEEENSEEDCPPPLEKECPEDGLHIFKHPKSCKHFFICYAGEDILFSCAPGLLFDPKNLWCDIPENVDCDAGGDGDTSNGDDSGDSTANSGSDSSEESDCPEPHEVECPSAEGFHTIKHPNSCEYYFVCLDGESGLLSCAPGLLFDSVNLWCDVADNVECHVNGTDSDEIECPSEDGFYAIKHPDNCEQYFICSGGEPILQECAPGLLFDPVNEWCDFAENVTCHLDGNPGPPDTPPPFSCQNDDGLFLHKDPKSCVNYYICSNGELIHMTCSDNLYYDPILEWCDFKENVECHLDKHGNSITLLSQANQECSADVAFETMTNPNDCNSYYVCASGVSASVKCAPGLAFDINNNRCDDSSLVNCKNTK